MPNDALYNSGRGTDNLLFLFYVPAVSPSISKCNECICQTAFFPLQFTTPVNQLTHLMYEHLKNHVIVIFLLLHWAMPCIWFPSSKEVYWSCFWSCCNVVTILLLYTTAVWCMAGRNISWVSQDIRRIKNWYFFHKGTINQWSDSVGKRQLQSVISFPPRVTESKFFM